MAAIIGVRRETKSPWEHRTPITPELARRLATEHGIEVLVQPSPRRVFHDKEYVRAGATMTEQLGDASVILGVKEVPPSHFEPETAYVFFSHVIKGQSYNMPMLAKILEQRCTLIDYERVTDDSGKRLIFFGRFAGLAGMIDSLWALGRRLAVEQIRTPLAGLEPAHAYDSLDDAKAAIREAGSRIASNGLPPEARPLVIGIAGYGNVASGVREILSELPTRELEPSNLATIGGHAAHNCIYQTTFREEHLVEPVDGDRDFDLHDYYDRPEGYRSTTGEYLPHLSVLMNCNYWDARYPRLVTKAQVADLYGGDSIPRLRVIGDLGCDVEGAVECTLKCTEPKDPVYVYDPATGTIESGVSGHGPVILAVDILPSELPLESSVEFSSALASFIPALARADYRVAFEDLDLPSALRRAVIAHRGRLTPDYSYLEEHLAGAKSP
jgi:alpha-aminoadipic semialdehyde synthase